VTASTVPGETEAAGIPLMGYPRAAGQIEPSAMGESSSYSVGSIAWSASLSHNGYDNNVATVTGNVLREFTRRGSEARR
jgi:hypothetical protein